MFGMGLGLGLGLMLGIGLRSGGVVGQAGRVLGSCHVSAKWICPGKKQLWLLHGKSCRAACPAAVSHTINRCHRRIALCGLELMKRNGFRNSRAAMWRVWRTVEFFQQEDICGLNCIRFDPLRAVNFKVPLPISINGWHECLVQKKSINPLNALFGHWSRGFYLGGQCLGNYKNWPKWFRQTPQAPILALKGILHNGQFFDSFYYFHSFVASLYIMMCIW